MGALIRVQIFNLIGRHKVSENYVERFRFVDTGQVNKMGVKNRTVFSSLRHTGKTSISLYILLTLSVLKYKLWVCFEIRQPIIVITTYDQIGHTFCRRFSSAYC